MTGAAQVESRPLGQIGLIATPGLFRIALALAVLLSHVSRVEVGRLAVLLFFFLSGYWIANIWDRKFERRIWPRYYASRYLRIIPLYLIVMLLAALALHKSVDLWNFTLLGLSTFGHDTTGVSWSLDVELQFYLLFPLIAAVLWRAPLWLVLAAAAAVSALGIWAAGHGVGSVLKYLPAFVLGSLTYIRNWRPGRNLALGSLAAFVVFSLVTLPFYTGMTPMPLEQDVWSFVWMLPLLPYVAHSLTLRSAPLDRHLGNLSYPIYLVHWPVVAVVHAQMGDTIPAKFVILAVALGISLALYVIVDRPIDRWRVRLTESSPAKTPRAA